MRQRIDLPALCQNSLALRALPDSLARRELLDSLAQRVLLACDGQPPRHRPGHCPFRLDDLLTATEAESAARLAGAAGGGPAGAQ